MLQQVRSNEAQARAQGQPGAYSSATGQQEGYWAYMQRQVQERTEKLGVLGESVNKLEDASASWASEASKYAKKTKQNMIMGAVKGRFGL
jgi:syntaxin-binding protein 5